MTIQDEIRRLTAAGALNVNVGCGRNIVAGWLNVDIAPCSGAFYMDAGWRFPFEDCSVDSYFAEHMIEHLDYEHQKLMLSEMHRTLKPRGKLRISYPSLENLFRCWSGQDTEGRKAWIQRHCRKWYKSLLQDFDQPPFSLVINDFMRMWGHKCIPDKELIGKMLRNAGFQDVKFSKPGSTQIGFDISVERHQFHFKQNSEYFNMLQTDCAETEKLSDLSLSFFR